MVTPYTVVALRPGRILESLAVSTALASIAIKLRISKLAEVLRTTILAVKPNIAGNIISAIV